MRILIADDDKNFGFVLKRELEQIHFTVDLVNNGVDAVLRFIEKYYNIVLLDLKMPRLNGIDALKIIKRVNPQVPVITFSGEADSLQQRESLLLGAAKYLQKPFAVEELEMSIKKHVPQM